MGSLFTCCLSHIFDVHFKTFWGALDSYSVFVSLSRGCRFKSNFMSSVQSSLKLKKAFPENTDVHDGCRNFSTSKPQVLQKLCSKNIRQKIDIFILRCS